jgi:hypothetical protein
MQYLILAFCGILVLGSTGAFLLYVSILSIMTIVMMMLALLLMFFLGVQFKWRRTSVSSPDVRHRVATTL